MLDAPADDRLEQKKLLEALRVRMFGRTPSAVRVGRYELQERLGAGGGGVVYAAWDTALQRRVALKLLRDGSDPDAGHLARRLRREGQALARVAHPNVLPIYDVGDADEQLFVAMELVDGTDLAAWLAQQQRSRDEILRVFIAAGHGLAAAHAAGVVHRDFKPANVLVGHDGHVRVMDFGIAALLGVPTGSGVVEAAPGAMHESDDGITLTGAILGTPAYMAPEQREHMQVGPAADQYSFAAALYEAICGELPRPGEPVERVRGSVHSVLVRALEEEPALRWPSMGALLEALQGTRGRRRRWRWAAGGLILAAGAVALTVSRTDCADVEAELWTHNDSDAVALAFAATEVPFADETWSRVDARLGELQRRWTEQAKATCDIEGAQARRRRQCLSAMQLHARSLVGLLRDADAQRVQHAVRAVTALPDPAACASDHTLGPRPGDAARFAQLDEAGDLAALGRYAASNEVLRDLVEGTDPDPNAVVYARAQLRWGRNLSTISEYPEAREHLMEAAWTAEAAGDYETAAEAMTELIIVEGDKLARYDAAQHWARHAKVAIERAGSPAALAAERLDNLGVLAYVRGDFDASAKYRLRALALVDDKVPSGSRLRANYLHGLGNVHFARNELDEAERKYREALAIRRELFGETHPRAVSLLLNLGNVSFRRGDLPQAKADYKLSLARTRAAFGPDNDSTGMAAANLANVHYSLTEYDEARALYREALRVWDVVYTEPHPHTADTLNNLGDLERRVGDPKLGREYLERAVTIYEVTLGRDGPGALNARRNLARMMADDDELDEARAILESTLSVRIATLGPNHPEVAQNLGDLSSILRRQGAFEEALALNERALSIREAAHGPEHAELAAPLHRKGTILWELARPDEAIVVFRRVLRVSEGHPEASGPRARAQIQLAELLWSAGERREARHMAQEALEAFEGPVHGPETIVELRRWLATHR